MDLCTGTGAVAVELAERVGKGGLVVALGFSSGMLEKEMSPTGQSKLVYGKKGE